MSTKISLLAHRFRVEAITRSPTIRFAAREYPLKDVGLLLLASPSRGSNYARLIRSIIRRFDHRMGRELEWESDSLRELDRQFRRMLEARSIPRLRGKGAFTSMSRWLRRSPADPS